MAVWYCGSDKYTAITQFAINHTYSIGDIVRQLAAPAVGSERAFRCTTAGLSAGTEAAWTLTKGSTTSQGTAVFTEITGNSTFGWTAAAARIDLFGPSAWAAAGDTIYVSSAHNETRAAQLNLGATGSFVAPNLFISVSAAGSVPPVAADYLRGAACKVTGANDITFRNSCAAYWGIDFTSGDLTNAGTITIGPATNGQSPTYELNDCSLNLGGNAAGGIINSGNGGNSSTSRYVLTGTNISFANAGQSILLRSGQLEWRNGSVTGATVPTNLFTSQAIGQGTALIDGCDLSSVTGTLVAALQCPIVVTFSNCKLNAGVTPAATPSVPGAYVNLINCDSGATNFKLRRHGYSATLTQETVIVRTGGASDGTTPESWKVVTNANCGKWAAYFETFPIAIWNDTTGVAKTLTVDIANDGVSLNDDEVVLEVEYLGSALTPVASRIRSGPANPLTAGAALAASSDAWTTTGLASPVKQSVSVTFTPQMKGLIRARLLIQKASQTLYIDPKVTII